MDNHYEIYAIHQDIQDQPLICIMLECFHQLSLNRNYQFLFDLTI